VSNWPYIKLVAGSLVKKLDGDLGILADSEVACQVLLVHGLALAVHTQGRREVARLHGHGPPARRLRNLVAVRCEQDRRPDAGEAAAHVPERGPPGREELLTEAEQVDLRKRSLVVRHVVRRLPLLVRRLEHSHPLAALRRVLVVPPPQPLVVVGVQRCHQDGRGVGAILAARRRSLVATSSVVVGLWQYVLLPRAREDLAVHVVDGDGAEAEHPDLHADPPLRRSQVRAVVRGGQPPHGVGRVEEVPGQEVAHAFLGGEQPAQLVLELRHPVQRWREIEVAVEQQPVDVAEHLLVLAAEEERVLELPPQAEVHVRRHARRRRVRGGPDGLGVEEPRVRPLDALPPRDQVGHREVLHGEPPRRARERLAEEVGRARGGQGGEEDAARQQRVEEAAHHGQHAVAEAVEGEPHHVGALQSLGAAAGPELLDGLGVERRARRAPPVPGLVGAQLALEVRRRRVREVLVVPPRLVPAPARPPVHAGRE
jgi:hypothetical protein